MIKYYHIFLEQIYILFVMFACIFLISFISVDTHLSFALFEGIFCFISPR